MIELFRGFDKSVGNKLDVEEFKNRLKVKRNLK